MLLRRRPIGAVAKLGLVRNLLLSLFERLARKQTRHEPHDGLPRRTSRVGARARKQAVRAEYLEIREPISSERRDLHDAIRGPQRESVWRGVA